MVRYPSCYVGIAALGEGESVSSSIKQDRSFALSRIASRLRTLRKTSARIGFGIANTSVAERRMLIFAWAREIPGPEALSALRESADAIVLDGGQQKGVPDVASSVADMMVGMRAASGSQPPQSLADSGYDFVISDVDGPMGLLNLKNVGCVVQVSPGVESNRLHAIGDLGVDAILLATESLDMGTLDAAVECRRVRTVSGRPVIVHLATPVSSEQVSVLWRAGVDALFIEVGEGMELLAATRSAVNAASYESRSTSRDTLVAIGANISSTGAAVEEDDVEEEEEDDDDE